MSVTATPLDAEVLAALPPKVQNALIAVIRASAQEFTGSLELHFKEGVPQQQVKRETERF